MEWESSRHFVPESGGVGPVAWWVTTGHAARLVRAGVELRLDVADATWLPGLPFELTDRRVQRGLLEELLELPAAPGFLKPATAKVDSLPATWVDSLPDAAARAIDAGASSSTVVQWTDVRLDLVSEHRVYLLDGAAVASSPYLVDGVAWEPGWDATSRPAETVAARRVAERAAAAGPRPDAMVIDVGLTASGRWVVVEANAPWAANPYGCDLVPVVDCVVASSCERPESRWTWVPDPHEGVVADRLPLLQPRR